MRNFIVFDLHIYVQHIHFCKYLVHTNFDGVL